MSDNSPNLITDYVEFRNNQKSIFTAGPASLIPENITGLRPCFGRGDNDYITLENNVIETLKKISGHKYLVRLQGSASLALEIITWNFLYGKILIISTGYYSERLKILADGAKNIQGEISQIDVMDLNLIDNLTGHYDWIVCCYTETSRGLKLPLKRIKKKAVELNSKIMLDATASIGLETDHDLADVIGYSSCKGLFGLTGAAFIAYNSPPHVEVDSFYLNLETHLNKGMTGPYHSICSLFNVLPQLDDFKLSVIENKKKFMNVYSRYINLPIESQPLLCTYVNCNIVTKNKKAVLYQPRGLTKGSVVCHIGEIHLREKAKGEIIDQLKIQN